MGTFDIHSDLYEMEELQGPYGNAAVGLFMTMGMWTSRNGRTGYVPDTALAESFSNVDDLAESIERLINVGLWRRDGEGYVMLRGAHADADLPMPLWRYSSEDRGGATLRCGRHPQQLRTLARARVTSRQPS